MNTHDAKELTQAIRTRAARRKMLTDAGNPIAVCSGTFGRHAKAGVAWPTGDGRPLEVTCYANTAAVDLEQEVVVPSGGDVRSYLTMNGGLFVDHQYDILSAVAKCKRMALDPFGWLCTGQFIETMDTAYARACVALAKAGLLAMSIGFEALDWGAPTKQEQAAYPGVMSIVRAWKALEVSYTAMPMNVTCRLVSTNMDAAAENAEKCRKSLIDAKVPDQVIKNFGIKPRRILVLSR